MQRDTFVAKTVPRITRNSIEGMDTASTGEITGISPANVAMKIHRIKSLAGFRKEDSMPDELRPDEMQDFWRNQPREAAGISAGDVRRKARQFEAKTRRGFLIEIGRAH